MSKSKLKWSSAKIIITVKRLMMFVRHFPDCSDSLFGDLVAERSNNSPILLWIQKVGVFSSSRQLMNETFSLAHNAQRFCREEHWDLHSLSRDPWICGGRCVCFNPVEQKLYPALPTSYQFMRWTRLLSGLSQIMDAIVMTVNSSRLNGRGAWWQVLSQAEQLHLLYHRIFESDHWIL